jgi:hypothetical protein
LVSVPFINACEMVTGTPLRGWSGRFFHSENMTFAHWDIAADAADLHEHQHGQEECGTSWRLSWCWSSMARNEGSAKAAAIVPPNTPHEVKVVGACRVVIADYPVRDELPGVRSD